MHRKGLDRSVFAAYMPTSHRATRSPWGDTIVGTLRKLRFGLLAAIIVAIGPRPPALAQTFTEFNFAGGAFDIAAGPDGALWFTEIAGPGPGMNIGRITTDGVFTRFPTPTGNGAPNASITAGPDGAMWFTNPDGNRIGRITMSGTVTEFPLPNPNSCPLSIVSAPDGALWFTEPCANKIGRITTAGAITEFPLPTFNSLSDSSLAVGADGALWYPMGAPNKIGRMTLGGTVTEFPLPIAGSFPYRSIAAGPDGALWYYEGSNKIGRITTDGAVTEFPLPTGGVIAGQIAAGADGAMWFTENSTNKIGRITTAGVITEYVNPLTTSGSNRIAAGPDGALWFTFGSSKIHRLSPGPSTSPLFAATLPSSRSVQVGSNVATAFASILNTGAAASGCGIVPVTPVPARFDFQTTDPATNQLTGTPNTRVSIAAGGIQSYLIAFTANGPFVPSNVVMGYNCTGTDAVASIGGVNTLLLTFSATPVADMIAVGLTPSNDGYSRTGGPTGTGLFVIAATNIGDSAPLTARVALSDATMPLTPMLCQTDPNTGQCLAPPAASVTTTIAQNQNTTWSAFLQANGAIAQDAAHHRVYFEFVDAGGVVRGSTSTAVTTQ